ncbi:MAG TPA: DUF4157 domain-containing protein, partial [Anaerolineales bacterium]|nr:DUF4157 domain-containing protein [Anaerolineales bacterium]
MEKIKEAAPESKAPATPQVEQQPKLPEKKAGPQMVARSLAAAALPPPDGTPPAARAGGMLTSLESGFGAPQRARMSKAVQRSVGNTHVSQSSSMGTRVQTKLTVGAPNDPYEQEADRTADAVLRMPEQGKLDNKANKPQAGPLSSQTVLMTKSDTGQPAVSPQLEQKINNSKGGGKALPEDTRLSMESSLGAGFRNVSIHTGSDAAEMNQELGAKAFTHGSDIYFNQGQYDPESSSGKHLLAHELTHVVQQASGPVSGTPIGGGLSVSDPSDTYEQAASRTADTVMRQLPYTTSPVVPGASAANHPGAILQRQEAASVDSTMAKSLFKRWDDDDLDDEELGRELAAILPGQRFVVYGVLDLLPSDETDDVAQEIVIALGSRLTSISEILRMRFIYEMVYGDVTDSEEGVIAQIWRSFGDKLPDMAAQYSQLWAKSIDESDQLNEDPWIGTLKQKFEIDSKSMAFNYLWENKRLIQQEIERLGIGERSKDQEPVVEPGYLEGIKTMAATVDQLQDKLLELRRIQVGSRKFPNPEHKGFPEIIPAYFNPESPPPIRPTGDEESSMPKDLWEKVKVQYDRVSAVISNFA